MLISIQMHIVRSVEVQCKYQTGALQIIHRRTVDMGHVNGVLIHPHNNMVESLAHRAPMNQMHEDVIAHDLQMPQMQMHTSEGNKTFENAPLVVHQTVRVHVQ